MCTVLHVRDRSRYCCPRSSAATGSRSPSYCLGRPRAACVCFVVGLRCVWSGVRSGMGSSRSGASGFGEPYRRTTDVLLALNAACYAAQACIQHQFSHCLPLCSLTLSTARRMPSVFVQRCMVILPLNDFWWLACIREKNKHCRAIHADFKQRRPHDVGSQGELVQILHSFDTAAQSHSKNTTVTARHSKNSYELYHSKFPAADVLLYR